MRTERKDEDAGGGTWGMQGPWDHSRVKDPL